MQASELLSSAREKAGITQREAAARCHVSFSSWNKWERGAPIPVPTLVGCLVMLGMSAKEALAAARQLGEQGG